MSISQLSSSLRNNASSTGLQIDGQDKPLPSPSRWGRVSICASRAQHQIHCFARRQTWIPSAGWRFTVLAGAGLAAVLCILNIGIMAWGYTKPYDAHTATPTLWQGDCTSTRNTFTYSHLAINICSTLLLGASNAAMQCLSAPTREAIDVAHASGRYLDVGISGFRNWTGMDRWRQWCWILLGISTIPLHLLYNSAIFQTTSANNYYALVVASDFLERGLADGVGLGFESEPDANLRSNLTTLARMGRLSHLSKEECIQKYNQPLISDLSNVLIVTTNHTEKVTASYYYYNAMTDPVTGGTGPTKYADWICNTYTLNHDCDVDYQLRHASTWNFTVYVDKENLPVTLLVDYCMAQPTTPQCTIQLVPEIMIAVVLCNTIKVLCFVFAARARTFQPLITLGDAVSSFIRHPDTTTYDLGPLSASDVREAEDRNQLDLLRRRRPTNVLPLRLGEWHLRRRRWFAGASRLRWGLTYILMITLWSVGWSLFILASPFLSTVTLTDQWQLGFGNVMIKLTLIITSSFGVVGNIFVANTPQLVLSLIYLSYNGLFTCILLCHEFSEYSRQRAPLRVSIPSARQRSSYFLSLPYRYALPLLGLAGLLHWALSQSIFLAEVKVMQPDGGFDPLHSLSCLGYSTLGLLVALLLGFVMILLPLALCWRHYQNGAPLVESSSLAISAACHLDRNGSNEGLLKYGACGDCVGLSAGPVVPLVTGKRYTKRNELDLELYTISAYWKFLPRRQTVLTGTAIVLSITKCGLAVAVCIDSWHHSVSVASSETAPLQSLPLVLLLPITCLYLSSRWAIEVCRVWKKRVIRRFLWDVIPELLLWLVRSRVYATFTNMSSTIYIVLAANEALSPQNLSFRASNPSPADEWKAQSIAGPFVYWSMESILTQEFNIAIWLIAFFVELWRWFDQSQYTLAAQPCICPRRLNYRTLIAV